MYDLAGALLDFATRYKIEISKDRSVFEWYFTALIASKVLKSPILCNNEDELFGHLLKGSKRGRQREYCLLLSREPLIKFNEVFIFKH